MGSMACLICLEDILSHPGHCGACMSHLVWIHQVKNKPQILHHKTARWKQKCTALDPAWLERPTSQKCRFGYQKPGLPHLEGSDETGVLWPPCKVNHKFPRPGQDGPGGAGSKVSIWGQNRTADAYTPSQVTNFIPINMMSSNECG
jgi:hypothetical protein